MRSPLLTAILAGLAAAGCSHGEWTQTELCLDVADDAVACPDPADVSTGDLFSFGWCSVDVRKVTGDGAVEESPFDSGNLVCCYPAEARDGDPGCAVGRPWQADARVVCEVEAEVPPAARPWLEAARMEHASVAAFARLTLDLMALGAPLALLDAVQRAASDEVEHARLCLDLASREAGRPLALGAFPFEGPIAPRRDAVAVAIDAVREGCLGETCAAWLAIHAAERASEGPVRAALSRIAADETRHAALSWRIVAWLRERPGVREAVIAALAEPFAVGRLGLTDAGFELLDEGAEAALIHRVGAEVIGPAARVLLG